MANNILKVKTNLFVTILVSMVSSAATLSLGLYLDLVGPGRAPMPLQVDISAGAINPNITHCEEGIYSPVQNMCVAQEVFDAEMQRLLAALGLDGSPYLNFPNPTR